MTGQPRFSIIPGWVVTDPRMKPRDLQVICLLGRHTSKKSGWCRRSQVEMSKEIDCARSTVQSSLDRLIDMGAVEKRVVTSPNGRDSAHWYRVIYDREPPAGYAFDAWDGDDSEENIPEDAADGDTPPAGISAPPAGPEPAPPADSGPAPINVSTLTTPAERKERETRKRDQSVSGSVINAALTKRVQKFCSGEGYKEGAWPEWEGSTIGHITKMFATLSADEMDAACEGRDAFLVQCRRRGVKKPMAVANYFRDRVWQMLEPADKAAVRPVAGGAQATASGKIVVPVFGPVFGAARAWSFVTGPEWFDLPDDLRELVQATYEAHERRGPQAAMNYAQRLGISIDRGRVIFPPDFEAQERARRTMQQGYPEAKRLNEAARDRAHVTVDPIFERLKDLCEPVPVGSPMWDEWRDYHEQRGWQFVPTPSGMRVVWFPKGGPDGIEAFARAAKERIEGDVHAAAE